MLKRLGQLQHAEILLRTEDLSHFLHQTFVGWWFQKECHPHLENISFLMTLITDKTKLTKYST